MSAAVVFYAGARTALVAVPYDHRAIVQALGWRKWDPKAKAWRILAGDLDHLLVELEAAGCPVRWRRPRSAPAVVEHPPPAPASAPPPWDARADLREHLANRRDS